MIILTGASGGIGLSLLQKLQNEEDVIALYNSHPPENINTFKNVEWIRLNITDPLQIEGFIDQNHNRFSELTLINAAGLKIDGLTMQYQLSDWDRMFAINVTANFLFAQKLLPFMIAEKWGRFIHFSSVVTTHADPGEIAYASCKSALYGLSKVLGVEYARFGITSNVLNLGYFDIGMFNKIADKARDKLCKKLPGGKLGKVDDIYNAIHFLKQSSFVNGSVINIDGGL